MRPKPTPRRSEADLPRSPLFKGGEVIVQRPGDTTKNCDSVPASADRIERKWPGGRIRIGDVLAGRRTWEGPESERPGSDRIGGRSAVVGLRRDVPGSHRIGAGRPYRVRDRGGLGRWSFNTRTNRVAKKAGRRARRLSGRGRPRAGARRSARSNPRSSGRACPWSDDVLTPPSPPTARTWTATPTFGSSRRFVSVPWPATTARRFSPSAPRGALPDRSTSPAVPRMSSRGLPRSPRP